ncbi:MAG: acyltransferase [Patescibacteria group bacterium]|jgi:acetyltransferase-like isoleucine patch superfamily enzyme
MTESQEKIIFQRGQLPPKNRLMLALLYLKWPLMVPGVKWLIRRQLKNCSEIDFIPGFRYLYGRLHARQVILGDTWFLDYAPVYIGEGTRFSWDNMVITGEHDLTSWSTVVARPVYIGKNVWVTSRCIILPGVHIGDNSVIGAGSVVTGDIPANCLAAGNPARVIREISRG